MPNRLSSAEIRLTYPDRWARRLEMQRARYWADPELSRSKAVERQKKNIDRYRVYQATSRDRRRDQMRAYDKARYWSNPEASRARRRRQYLANPEAARSYSRQRCKEKPELYRMYANTRRARLLAATPPWVDVEQLLPIFKEAHDATRRTGVRYEVDHIYPLKHSRLCGLHVPWNLRVITKSENNHKRNRIPGEKWELQS